MQKSYVNAKNTRLRGKLKLLYDRIKIILAGAVFPDDCRCIVCDKEIPKDSKYCMCEDCTRDFPFNNGRICVSCGAPIRTESCYCLECQNHNKDFDFVRSSLKYEGVAKRLLIQFKFYGKRWLAKYLGEMLTETYLENVIDAQVIVPVPISYEREKSRGYNQSMLLAKVLSRKLGLPIVSDVLIKIKDNRQQSALSVSERRENVVGTYGIFNRDRVKGKKVLVVDDILTTGSTISEVARQLKIAGATNVYGLVVASPKYILQMENNAI